jgi:beta-1,4-mannosyltransferase
LRPHNLKVLFSQRSLDDPTNPYSRLLFSHLALRLRIVPFSWKNALLGTYEVFHLQWPEYMVREKTLGRRLLNYALCHALWLRLQTKGIPVVETVHNLQPHEATSSLERRSVALLRRLVCQNIYLNNSTENDLSIGTVILHGDYSPALQGLERSDAASRSSYFLFFGLIRPYKGMEGLIGAFARYEGPVDGLVIAGMPTDSKYAHLVENLASTDTRISLDFRHIPEADLLALVSGAAAVVLPYRYMYNSGALLYALSVGTPVLVPASPANESIQEEVGVEWLTMFTDEITQADLGRVIAAHADVPAGALPDLSGRSWDSVAEQHLNLYIAVSKHARP